MGLFARSSFSRKPDETMKLFVTLFVGMILGFFLRVSFPNNSSPTPSLLTTIHPTIDVSCFGEKDSNFSTSSVCDNRSSVTQPVSGSRSSVTQPVSGSRSSVHTINISSIPAQSSTDLFSKIWVPSNPRGAERLPPGIVEAQSDLYMRRLWGNPDEDLKNKPKYLVAFTVGYKQRMNVDACVKRFSENFTIVLFHYDDHVTEWNEFEWSKRAIHVSVSKQTKWWYAKRFLHPDIVAPYDYIFMWDEDLGVQHFHSEQYIKLVKKHGLEISQPGLDSSSRAYTWEMTKRREGLQVHREPVVKPDWCQPHRPPCAAFVEIMAPVFSRDAWRCVWHMLQNDLVHGWGLDFALKRCVAGPAHEKIGVVDAEWIIHQSVPSLGDQGKAQHGKSSWEMVNERCKNEWRLFQHRIDDAENSYFKSIANGGNSTSSIR